MFKKTLFKGLYRTMSTSRIAPLLLTPSEVSFSSKTTAHLTSTGVSQRLSQKTVFIDASWVLPNTPRKPKEEFAAFHIPTARFLDIDEVASHTEEGSKLGLKHMMPEPQVFARACGKDNQSYCKATPKYDHLLFKRNWVSPVTLMSFCESIGHLVYIWIHAILSDTTRMECCRPHEHCLCSG